MHTDHLFLIGYRGSGKSTIGRKLAAALDRQFVDTDDVVEQSSSKTIREIFAERGESAFRDLEEQAVSQSAVNTAARVIALGGGAVLRESNRRLIRSSGRCVWLKGSAEALHARITADQTSPSRRPSLSQLAGYNEVVELLAAREPLYRELAELTVETDGRQPDDIVAEIAAWARRSP